MSELPELWAHQKEAIERATKLDHYALFMEPGTGKTRTTLEILRHRYNTNKRILRTLVICPLIVTRNWKAEIKKYTKIPDEKVHLLTGTILEKAHQLKHIKDGIVIVNYDIFVKREFADAAALWAPEILILDESHRCKDPSSKRTKNIIRLSQSMIRGYRIIMSGTPVTNNQLDLWSQLYILDHGKTFGNSYYAYKNHYFVNLNQNKPAGRNFPLWVPRPGVDKIINEKLKLVSSIAKKSTCLDLPPFIELEIEVELSKEQRKIYNDMKRDFIAFVNDKEAVADLALTKMMKMRQIISGFLKMEDGSIETFENPREKVLSELLSDICTSSTNKVIVWAVFHEDYETIRNVCKGLNLPYYEIHGLVSEKQKFENMDAFEASQEAAVLIGSPKAGGIGINLVSASTSIWYSRSYSFEESDQAEARNYRGGSEQHSSIARIDLIAKGTLDELILKSVKDKKNISEAILSIDTTLL